MDTDLRSALLHIPLALDRRLCNRKNEDLKHLNFNASSPRRDRLSYVGLFYVGARSSKYPPTKPKRRSGDQAAKAAGRVFTFPIASKRPAITQ